METQIKYSERRREVGWKRPGEGGGSGGRSYKELLEKHAALATMTREKFRSGKSGGSKRNGPEQAHGRVMY